MIAKPILRRSFAQGFFLLLTGLIAFYLIGQTYLFAPSPELLDDDGATKATDDQSLIATSSDDTTDDQPLLAIPPECIDRPTTCFRTPTGEERLTRVTYHDFTVTEGFDVELITRFTRQQLGSSFRACYESWRRENLSAPEQGTLTFTAYVTQDHKIAAPRILASELGLPDVERCLLDTFYVPDEDLPLDELQQVTFTLELRPVCDDQTPRPITDQDL